jgi:hypothetical protein
MPHPHGVKSVGESTVPRRAYLLLEKILTDERITFLRELSTLRMALEMAQLHATASPRGGGGSLYALNGSGQPMVCGDDNNVSGQFCSQSPVSQLPPRRIASAVNFASLPRCDTSMALGGPGASLTSIPSAAHLSPSPLAPPQPPPELASMKMLSDALASAQVIDDLKELYDEEIKSKDKALEALREQLEERYREGECEWNNRLRQIKHEARVLEQTHAQEKERYRVETRASVGDELKREREISSELRARVVVLDQQVGHYKQHIAEHESETRNLRLQIANLQQERVAASLERTEARAALMAISAEKIALERRVRQLESGRGGHAQGRRGSALPPALQPHVGAVSRRSISLARMTPQEDAIAAPPSIIPVKPSTTRPVTSSAKALDNILDFALDDDMASRIRVSIAKQKETSLSYAPPH